MIEYVKARNIFTKISTNLHAFRPEDAEHLVRTGLDDLAISLHGLSEESYRAYQPRHRLAPVLENIKTIVAAKQRLGSPTPDVHLGFIVTRHNEHEVDRVPEFAAALGVGYLLEETSLNLRLLPYDRQMNLRGIDEAMLRRERLDLANRWLPKEDSYVNRYYRYVRTHDGALPAPGQVRFSCTAPWRQVVICVDGDVHLCCGSFDRRHGMGNIFEEPLRQIWNNVLYRTARRRIRGTARVSGPPVLCSDCPGMLL
jgi:MoaA/NifB/PqqE/SkfB family radical SAM enzyme